MIDPYSILGISRDASDEEVKKAYRTMKNSGAGSIVIGIIILVTGVAAGVISIVNGASLLKNKNEITF